MAHLKARGHYDNYDMCGIAGIIDFTASVPEEGPLRRMIGLPLAGAFCAMIPQTLWVNCCLRRRFNVRDTFIRKRWHGSLRSVKNRKDIL